MFGALCTLLYFICTNVFYYFHVTGEELKAQKGGVTYPKSHSEENGSLVQSIDVFGCGGTWQRQLCLFSPTWAPRNPSLTPCSSWGPMLLAPCTQPQFSILA